MGSWEVVLHDMHQIMSYFPVPWICLCMPFTSQPLELPATHAVRPTVEAAKNLRLSPRILAQLHPLPTSPSSRPTWLSTHIPSCSFSPIPTHMGWLLITQNWYVCIEAHYKNGMCLRGFWLTGGLYLVFFGSWVWLRELVQLCAPCTEPNTLAALVLRPSVSNKESKIRSLQVVNCLHTPRHLPSMCSLEWTDLTCSIGSNSQVVTHSCFQKKPQVVTHSYLQNKLACSYDNNIML